jgi:hypothetical protein
MPVGALRATPGGNVNVMCVISSLNTPMYIYIHVYIHIYCGKFKLGVEAGSAYRLSLASTCLSLASKGGT